jgi:DNA-binding HxlR family transcriptional regulator
MELIGSKWKMPILWNLTKEDALHYNELKRRVAGITNTMLTRSLRDLEEDGLVRRMSDGSVPPSVTYHLTEEGKKLIPSLNGLYAWGEAHQGMRFSKNKEP